MHNILLCCVVDCAARNNDGLWHIISNLRIKKQLYEALFLRKSNYSNVIVIISSMSFTFKNTKDITFLCPNILIAKNIYRPELLNWRTAVRIRIFEVVKPDLELQDE